MSGVEDTNDDQAPGLHQSLGKPYLFSGSATKRAAPIRPRAPRAPYAVGGTANTPSAMCETTSDTPALATMLAPLGALRIPLHCLHNIIIYFVTNASYAIITAQMNTVNQLGITSHTLGIWHTSMFQGDVLVRSRPRGVQNLRQLLGCASYCKCGSLVAPYTRVLQFCFPDHFRSLHLQLTESDPSLSCAAPKSPSESFWLVN